MEEFKKILVPVDLSEASAKLVPYATAMAEKFGAQIDLLFVARILQHFTSIYVPHTSVDGFEKEITEGAEKKLEEFKEEHFPGVENVRTRVTIGYIPEEIFNFVLTEGIDLIIMGTHGRKGLDKVIFGSVAERVVQSSPVPVLLINPYKSA
jgi:nucleotide-binding universal stress UspA family protein